MQGCHIFRRYGPPTSTGVADVTAAIADADLDDAHGLRVLKRKGGVSSYRMHGLDGSLLVKFDLAAGTRQEHIHVGGQRIATR
ncbi:MAG: hypothetical protein HY778_10705 [Betaproteobacteria bacterium]|nr:hypothetical protein [Betaproteobacteria bacterium]